MRLLSAHGGHTMHRVRGTDSSQSHKYWNGRAVETQFLLAQAESGQLRGVYSQLVGHYQRMARLYDATAHLPFAG